MISESGVKMRMLNLAKGNTFIFKYIFVHIVNYFLYSSSLKDKVSPHRELFLSAAVNYSVA